MDYYELIAKRESIRNYDPDRPIDQKTLDRILNAGRLAPSAANLQPWKFLVIQSPEMLKKIHQSYDKAWFRDAPYVLIIIGDINESWQRKADDYNSIETDLTIAMDHIILAAENEGVGTCWIEEYNPNSLRKTLSLSDNEKVFSITPLGYPQESFQKKGQKQRKPLEDIVEYL